MDAGMVETTIATEWLARGDENICGRHTKRMSA